MRSPIDLYPSQGHEYDIICSPGSVEKISPTNLTGRLNWCCKQHIEQLLKAMTRAQLPLNSAAFVYSANDGTLRRTGTNLDISALMDKDSAMLVEK